MVDDRSKVVRELVKVGLPSKKEMMSLAERELASLPPSSALPKQLAFLRLYEYSMENLVHLLQSTGGLVSSALADLLDLQSRIKELELKIVGEGKNPLENRDYMRARELADKKLSFISKHKLDTAEFLSRREGKKAKSDDDLYEVKVE